MLPLFLSVSFYISVHVSLPFLHLSMSLSLTCLSISLPLSIYLSLSFSLSLSLPLFLSLSLAMLLFHVCLCPCLCFCLCICLCQVSGSLCRIRIGRSFFIRRNSYRRVINPFPSFPERWRILIEVPSYIRGFCHYPHRGVDAGRHICKTTEYKSTESPFPPFLLM